ncbi:MAG: hypothetical protein GY845_09545, partial [Planctomycetes bacterium]|nr:hypothetical protein [Planctomycetota bacterium]
MPRGKTLIPELQVTTLTRFIEKFKEPPNLMLSAMFPGSDYPSNTIKWESQEGTRELAKFKAPGAPT